MATKNRIRIELTSEQIRRIKETSGHEISALEFSVEELEQRIAPFCASGTHIPETHL